MKIGKNESKVYCCKCGSIVAISDGIVIEQVLCLSCYFEEELKKSDGNLK